MIINKFCLSIKSFDYYFRSFDAFDWLASFYLRADAVEYTNCTSADW